MLFILIVVFLQSTTGCSNETRLLKLKAMCIQNSCSFVVVSCSFEFGTTKKKKVCQVRRCLLEKRNTQQKQMRFIGNAGHYVGRNSNFTAVNVIFTFTAVFFSCYLGHI